MALATAELAGRLLLCLRADGATYKYRAGWWAALRRPSFVPRRAPRPPANRWRAAAALATNSPEVSCDAA